MISNALSEAVSKIDRYLSEAPFKAMYQGELRTRILLVRNAMEDLCEELETPASLQPQNK